MQIRWVIGGGFAALAGTAVLGLGVPAAWAVADPPAAIVLPSIPGVASSSHAASAGGGAALTGTFRITAGSCSGVISGSWFRMLSPAGSPVTNSDSPCSDQSYTPLSPGTDGGLTSGGYQPDPSPAFDGAGNGLADRILQPAKFYGIEFSVATDPTDPQTGTAVAAPSISSNGGTLSGDLRAFTVSWNNQHFNQGAPKPDGTSPGKTSGPSGTYNPANGAYKLTWSSQIVGGPFNNFTGTWQLEGTFAPSSPASAATGSGSSSAGSASSTNTSSTPAGQPVGAAPTPSSAAGPSASTSLPVTGGHVLLWPAAALLSGGVLVRGLIRRTKSRGARP